MRVVISLHLMHAEQPRPQALLQALRPLTAAADSSGACRSTGGAAPLYKGTADALIRIFREEGMNGLYRCAHCPGQQLHCVSCMPRCIALKNSARCLFCSACAWLSAACAAVACCHP